MNSTDTHTCIGLVESWKNGKDKSTLPSYSRYLIVGPLLLIINRFNDIRCNDICDTTIPDYHGKDRYSGHLLRTVIASAHTLL